MTNTNLANDDMKEPTQPKDGNHSNELSGFIEYLTDIELLPYNFHLVYTLLWILV